jgi:hypothetical protein
MPAASASRYRKSLKLGASAVPRTNRAIRGHGASQKVRSAQHLTSRSSASSRGFTNKGEPFDEQTENLFAELTWRSMSTVLRR